MEGLNASFMAGNRSGCDNSSFEKCQDEEADDSALVKAIVVIEVVLAIVGILGNVALFSLMQRKRFSQFTYAIYFSFSAVFDSWFLFINALMDSMEQLQRIDLVRLAAKSGACKIIAMSDSLPQWVCPWLIVALTVDRFVSICFPNRGLWYSTRRKAILVCSGIVLLWLIVSITEAVYQETETITDEDEVTIYDCTSSIPRIEIGDTLSIVFIFLIPLLLVLVLSGMVLRTLWKTRRQSSLLTEKARVERMNYIIVYVLIATCITWLPLFVVNMISISYELNRYVSQETDTILDTSWHYSLVVYMSIYALNFYILMLFSPVFRSEGKKMVEDCFRKSQETDADEEIDLTEYGHLSMT